MSLLENSKLVIDSIDSVIPKFFALGLLLISPACFWVGFWYFTMPDLFLATPVWIVGVVAIGTIVPSLFCSLIGYESQMKESADSIVEAVAVAGIIFPYIIFWFLVIWNLLGVSFRFSPFLQIFLALLLATFWFRITVSLRKQYDNSEKKKNTK